LIDLRYHIVSLMAVFLALALGILLGSSVIQGALVDRLESDIDRYKEERDAAVAEAGELKAGADQLTTRSVDIAPWAVHQRLEGSEVVLVSDGSVPDWRDHVLGALEDAGAEPSGTVVLEDRWELAEPEDGEELDRILQEVAGSPVAATSDPAQEALSLLGARFFDEMGTALIDELERAGFVSVQGRPDGDWPVPGSLVVFLSEARPRAEAPLAGGGAFVDSIATDARAPGVLIASDKADGRSLVAQLRADDEELPDNIATFDSATEDSDPGGVGVVAALVAAIEERGGHFGAEDGRRFVAPPADED
jgi:hypothetical protein